jgi:NAD(P)-dependent dehydrogenase (short-subunit alcohol dehydrogenase family)
MSTYLITGATRGIGRAVADLLAADELLLLGRDGATLEAACAELPSARPLVADLAHPESLEAVLAGVELPEALDGVVHSAGIAVNGDLAELTAADWATQFAVNVTAVAELTRLVVDRVHPARGTVVLVNSGAGRAVKRTGGTAYAASKHALVALAAGLRLEVPGIRVSTVYPGRVATDMQRELRAFEGGEYVEEDYLQVATVARVIVEVLHLPADAVVEDVILMPNS